MASIIGKHKSFLGLRFQISNICFAAYSHLPGDAPKLSLRVKEWPSSSLPVKRRHKAISCFGCLPLQNVSSVCNAVHSTSRMSFPAFGSHSSANRAYSSAAGNNRDAIEFTPASSKADFPLQNTDAGGKSLTDIFNQVYQSTLDAANSAGKIVDEAAKEAGPYIDKLFESNPYLKEIVVPVSWTLSASALAWLVLPRMLRKFHHYTNQTPFAVLSGNSTQELIPYEKSLWGSLEDPARYLITFVAFSQLSVFIVPSVSLYLSQAWRGALVLSVVWFLHRWKTSLLSVALAKRISSGPERDRLVALNKLSSVGLFTLGIMALAEACGIAVQSILTVGGIGGVATAFAAKDILGNLLSGLSLQFSQPFSLGDSIKVTGKTQKDKVVTHVQKIMGFCFKCHRGLIFQRNTFALHLNQPAGWNCVTCIEFFEPFNVFTITFSYSAHSRYFIIILQT
ncbi:mechanosensitive ion channel protein isoform X2 [Wolffia australiana]